MNGTDRINRPTKYSYKVDDHVWAGEYPRNFDEATSIEKIDQFRRFGITHFIDLTEVNELKPYEPMLWDGAQHLRFEIEDGGIPESAEKVRELINKILKIIADNPNAILYIHCWGGIGRTSQIVAAYLAISRHFNFDTTMFMLRLKFSQNPKSQWRTVPENRQQLLFIRKICEELEG